ncbi:uncharacterized protein N7459_007620 [Penicillium hispanicum]|uniref:uncharacterized protein n=1 Tax=Penicillium hispanicum TaxID=1080232 RepID=UPI00253FBC7A|nr:uncharacterized protein N7459_007620 [Penicillium hispanicum]KAJ5578656.1 hypothetical protein N7459_007620 [Penicillium hispanicum]
MQISQPIKAILLLATTAPVHAWNRLDKDNTALLAIDHQVGLSQLLPFLDKYQFAYGLAAHHHAGAIQNGTLSPIEETLI